MARVGVERMLVRRRDVGLVVGVEEVTADDEDRLGALRRQRADLGERQAHVLGRALDVVVHRAGLVPVGEHPEMDIHQRIHRAEIRDHRLGRLDRLGPVDALERITKLLDERLGELRRLPEHRVP